MRELLYKVCKEIWEIDCLVIYFDIPIGIESNVLVTCFFVEIKYVSSFFPNSYFNRVAVPNGARDKFIKP